MNVSFYVLTENKAQDFLGFICQLTQTALNKSNQSLLILIADDELLATLDKALWVQEATSFIPHQRLLDADTDINYKVLACVLLSPYMPANFKGMVLNTTIRPVSTFISTTINAQPTRVLELIKPDATSVQEGRHKYKSYQKLGYELTHFNV